MMSFIATFYAGIIQIVVNAVLLFLAIRLLIKNKESLPVVFLVFNNALWLFSNTYWLIYDFLRPDMRMPFAANEFGEAGLFLTFATVVNSAIPRGIRVAKKFSIGTFLFSLCNIILWILWSGEWVQDILIGLVFAYVTYSVVCSLDVVNTLKKTEWILIVLFSVIVIAGQFTTFFVDENIKTLVDSGCYVLLLIGEIYWIIRYIYSSARKHSPKVLLTLAAAGVVWSSTSLYMSEGTIYNVFLLLENLTLIFMYISVSKLVRKR